VHLLRLWLHHRARRARPAGIRNRQMCSLPSLERARKRGFRAMQFNFVVSTNAARAIQISGPASIQESLGGYRSLPSRHPTLGFVDALVMHRQLK